MDDNEILEKFTNNKRADRLELLLMDGNFAIGYFMRRSKVTTSDGKDRDLISIAMNYYPDTKRFDDIESFDLSKIRAVYSYARQEIIYHKGSIPFLYVPEVYG